MQRENMKNASGSKTNVNRCGKTNRWQVCVRLFTSVCGVRSQETHSSRHKRTSTSLLPIVGPTLALSHIRFRFGMINNHKRPHITIKTGIMRRNIIRFYQYNVTKATSCMCDVAKSSIRFTIELFIVCCAFWH